MPQNIQHILGTKLEPYEATADGGLGFEVTGTGAAQTVPNPYTNKPAALLFCQISTGILTTPSFVYDYAGTTVATESGGVITPGLIRFFLTAGRVVRLIPIADKG